MSEAKPNHRRHHRVGAKGVSAHLDSDGRSATFSLANLSKSGAFVRTEDPLPVGTSVLLKLTRPSVPVVSLAARVVTSVDADAALESGAAMGMGIAFEHEAGSEDRLVTLLGELGTSVSSLEESSVIVAVEERG